MRSLLFPWVFLPVLAAAQINNGVAVVGVISAGGPSSANASTQATELAGRHPNGTTSIPFQRLVNDIQETWSWRVNITDIAVPNEPTNLGMSSANYSEHLHMVNTQWELQWPDDNNASESFTDYLERIDSRAEFNAMILHLPSNITHAYSNQTNGNCTTILGDDCVRSIESAASTGGYITTSDLTGCTSTLDVARPGTGAGLGFAINPAMVNRNVSTPELQPNGTLFYYTSNTFTHDNLTLYTGAMSAVQVFIMQLVPLNASTGSSDATVLCQIVDKTQASAATSWRQSSRAAWAAVLITFVLMICQ